MGRNTGSFNSSGKISDNPEGFDHSDPLDRPHASEETLAASLAEGEQAEQGEETEEQEAPIDFVGYTEEVPIVDAELSQEGETPNPNAASTDGDNDGHNDETGEFVEGNQEAANAAAETEAESETVEGEQQ